MNLPHSFLYALACVALPVVWGLLMVAVVNAFERVAARRRPAKSLKNSGTDIPSPEYHI